MVSTPHAGARDGWPAARDRIWAKHGLAKFATRYDTKAKHLAIDLISVPAESKGQGNASRAMKDALAWADDHGVTVTLSPTSEFGSSKARLTKWYRSLGFVPNKGRNKDFRFTEAMIRPPTTQTMASSPKASKPHRATRTAKPKTSKPKTNKNGQARELIKEYKLDVVGNDVRQAAQIAAKVRKGIQEAADICKISPPVCVGNLGLPRSKMPQIEGDLSVVELLGGDRANPPKGEAIIAAGGSPTDERTTLDQFLDALEDKGVKTRRRRVPVGNLKATQREIKAAKVYGMADAHLRGNFPNLDKQIVVSNDGHILDGHHRWAALLTIDPKRRMSVLEVDLPMAELLHEAAATPGVYRANFAGAPLGTAAQREYKRTHRSKLRGGSKSRPRLSKSAAWKEILG